MQAESHGKRGQSLVEIALLLPVLLWLSMGIIDFGRAYYFNNIAINAARSGARVATDFRNDATVVGNAVRADAGTKLQITSIFVNYADPYHSSGTDVTVTVEYRFPLITVLLGQLVGNPQVVRQSATMKMMY